MSNYKPKFKLQVTHGADICNRCAIRQGGYPCPSNTKGFLLCSTLMGNDIANFIEVQEDPRVTERRVAKAIAKAFDIKPMPEQKPQLVWGYIYASAFVEVGNSERGAKHAATSNGSWDMGRPLLVGYRSPWLN